MVQCTGVIESLFFCLSLSICGSSHIHTCIHTHIHTGPIHTNTCMHTHTHTHAHTHAHTHWAYTHTHIHTRPTHTHTHTHIISMDHKAYFQCLAANWLMYSEQPTDTTESETDDFEIIQSIYYNLYINKIFWHGFFFNDLFLLFLKKTNMRKRSEPMFWKTQNT